MPADDDETRAVLEARYGLAPTARVRRRPLDGALGCRLRPDRPRHDLQAVGLTVLASVRPDDVNVALLLHVVGLGGHVVPQRAAEPGRHPVRAEPRPDVGRIGPVFREGGCFTNSE